MLPGVTFSKTRNWKLIIEAAPQMTLTKQEMLVSSISLLKGPPKIRMANKQKSDLSLFKSEAYLGPCQTYLMELFCENN